jgi:hypothetical protein
MYSVKNVPSILEAIQRAGVPPKFTYDFFSKQLGFTSSSDRPIIPLLKALKFIDDSGVPLDRYKRFKDKSEAGPALAEGLRDAYADIFASDQAAQNLRTEDLTGIFARVSGKSEAVAEKMATTFKAFCNQADFDAPRGQGTDSATPSPESTESADAGVESLAHHPLLLHHDIHVHLPVSTDMAVYDAIFGSLRRTLAT